MKSIKLCQFGNPILRQVARQLTHEEIKSSEIHRLIKDIRDLNEVKKYGVGLAAPQIGVGVAVSVIVIKPTPNHPEFKSIEMVIINPRYQGIGRRNGLWEGCQSAGSGNNTLYGKALRYKHFRAQWVDEFCQQHDEELTGFVAHVFQHETDHLQGILFVDRVRDTTSYM